MILVTGGTGLVGSHLLYKLALKDEKIRATYRTEKSLLKAKSVFGSYARIELFDKIDWVQVDITDYFALSDVLVGVNYIYHCAAVVSFDRKDAENMMHVNVDGTSQLVNLSLEYGIKKFCFVSSISALGEYENGKCVDENAEWQYTSSTSNYSISKYYAENEVWRASEEGLNVVIVNPATIIGFGELTESSSTLIKSVKDGLSFFPTGANGFVGVEDVVTAMIKLMESEISGKRFLLVAENWTFERLFSNIANSFKLNPPRFKVSKPLATVYLYFEQLKSFLFNSTPTLSREKINSAYSIKCYSADRIKNELSFEFTELGNVIDNAVKHYQKNGG